MSQIKATIFSEFAKELPYKISPVMQPLVDALTKIHTKGEWDDYINRCLNARGRTHRFGCYCLPKKSLEK